MSEMIKGGCYVKHTMSCAGDLQIDYEIDPVNKVLETKIEKWWFDSSLFADFIVSYLPKRHGIVAFMDDNAKGDGWFTPDADYKLYVSFCGLRFSAKVVRLFRTNEKCDARIAVILDAKGVEQRLF